MRRKLKKRYIDTFENEGWVKFQETFRNEGLIFNWIMEEDVTA